MIQYRCGKCGAPMESPESMTGKVEPCPSCGTLIRVPAAKRRGRPVRCDKCEKDLTPADTVKVYRRRLLCDKCTASLEKAENIALPVATEDELNAPPPPDVFSGWLLLVALSLLGEILLFVLGAIFASDGIAWAGGGSLLGTGFVAAMFAGYFLLMIWAAVSFFAMKHSAPRAIIAWLAVNGVMGVLALLINHTSPFRFGPLLLDIPGQMHSLWIYYLLPLLFIPYFILSKRVKETFVFPTVGFGRRKAASKGNATIQNACPQCGANLESPDSMGGELDKCPMCRAECSVPSPKPPKKRAFLILGGAAGLLVGAALAVVITIALTSGTGPSPSPSMDSPGPTAPAKAPAPPPIAIMDPPQPRSAQPRAAQPQLATPPVLAPLPVTRQEPTAKAAWQSAPLVDEAAPTAAPVPPGPRPAQPHPTTGELGKAWAAMDKKDWSTAAKILTALSEKQKDNPVVWFAFGYLHFNLGNHEIAIKCYRTAIALKPDYAQAYCEMGPSYYVLGRYAEAIEAYKKAVAVDPNCGRAYILMSCCYSKQGRNNEAIQVCQQAIATDKNNAEAYLCMGSAYTLANRYAEAIEAYKQAIAKDPQLAGAYFFIGSIYGALGRHAEAIEALKQAVAADPRNTAAYFAMGPIYMALGRHDEAIETGKKVIAIDPNDGRPYVLMGNIYYALGRHAEAIEAYEKAIVVCKQAIALGADAAEPYRYIGLAYSALGSNAEAIEAFKQAVTADPRNAGTYFVMGNIYVQLKRYPEAIEAYEKVLLLMPSGSVVDEVREKLRTLRLQAAPQEDVVKPHVTGK